MVVTEGSRIKKPYYAKQLIDFQGLEIDNGIYPTDIDALIEYHDAEYILLEIKYQKSRVQYSQRIAIQRMIDDFTKIGKKAIAIIGEHCIADVQKPIIAADCIVREIYYGEEGIWRAPNRPLLVKQAVDELHGVHNGGVCEQSENCL